MNVVSSTPLKVAPLVGRLNFPKHSVTWIVKGTFDLQPGGSAVIAGDQPFPTGDEFFPDDAEKTGSPRYESDFAWHKPRADLLLVGACHAPNGRAVPSCPATFRVGNQSKTLAVFGNRHWEKSWLSWKLTEPEPFTRMELRYEKSFGGEKFPANPVGAGFAEKTDGAGGKLWPLPNVEDPARLIQSSGNRPAPAGFGPLGNSWVPRRDKLGTYKGAYLKTRWPWFPEDFDWTHFNAAPTEMQLDGFLRGDERLVCENLHPKHARYESQLPGVRPRCFLNRLTGGKRGELRFEEVELKLDTLWVDMEAEKLVLVWRGWTAVASEDYEEEIQDVFLISESLSQSPASVERCHRDFRDLLSAAAKPFEPELPPEPTPAEQTPRPAPAAAAALEAARKKEKEEAKKTLEAQAAALNSQMGLDKLSPEIQEQHRQSQSKLIERLAENDPAKSAQASHEADLGNLRTAMGQLGLDPDNLPPLTEKARGEVTRLMQELGPADGSTAENPEMAGFATMLGAVLGKTGMDLENLEPLVAEAKKRKLQLGLQAEAEPKAVPPLTRESVQAKLAGHGSFEAADLRGLDLSGLDLQGADFAGANLSGVPLRKSKLQQANFSKANLTNADLTEADLTNASAAAADFSGAKLRQTILKEADLTGAKLAKADLTQAILDGAILEEAVLTGACLVESSAIHALFPRADLTGVNFQKSVCMKANFSKATLHQADFQKADLTEASVIGAVGHQINFAAAVLTKLRANGDGDYTGAKLIQAQGNGSMWKGANLTGADFHHAQMEEAIFTSACLKQANLSAANLKFARFNKANLAGAKLIRANLFQGNFEKADLTQTDLSGANLYEAEFLSAVLNRTVTDGANLLMTKLEVK